MGSLGITSLTAWITALLLGVQGLLGLCRVRASAAAGSARTWALTGHTIIGFVLSPLAFAHAWFSMKLPSIRATNASGLWIATAALLLLAAQALTGMTMLPQIRPQRVAIRRGHFAMAILLGTLVSAHVFLKE